MDWNNVSLEEAKDRNWFKPVIGQQVVKFLSEGEEYTTEWEDKTIEKVGLNVEVNGVQHTWGVTKGKTQMSLFGQLALVAKNRPQLTGSVITLVVKGSGKETEYTIVEALAYMTKEEKIVN